MDVPVYAARTVSKLLPKVSASTVIFCAGVKEYQIVAPSGAQDCDSPGSVVAALVDWLVEKGTSGITVALAKLSLGGGVRPGATEKSRKPVCPKKPAPWK